MRLFPLLALPAVLHLYVGARIVPTLPGAIPAVLFTLLLLASVVLVPMGVFARFVAKPPLAETLAWVGLLFMGLFSSLLVLTFVRDMFLVLAAIVTAVAGPAALPMNEIRSLTAAGIPVLAFIVTLFGFVNARRTAGVVTIDIPVLNLPIGLHGFTIVQISDVHVGPTIRERYVERIVEAVNRLKPDVVAITGDLVDGTVAELRDQVAPLGRLKSRDGRYFVTGNHEYYSGAVSWMAELERLGIQVLHNEHVVIERDFAKLVLAGVPDYGAGHYDESHRSDPQKSLVGAPGDAAVKILLAHQPRSAAAASEAGFDLQLSGHTHGGQFWPWNHFVKFQQPFTAGLHRLDELLVYVSRGTGYWGPPKRLFAPSEITQIRLKPAPA